MSKDEIAEANEAMVRAGVDAIRDESHATPHSDLVNLIYMAMEYQRRRDTASSTKS